MSRKCRSLLIAGLALAASILELGWLEGKAHAIIGRPLTPFSYAGVARRTTRRAVYTGAAMGAYGAYGPSPYYW